MFHTRVKLHRRKRTTKEVWPTFLSSFTCLLGEISDLCLYGACDSLHLEHMLIVLL